MNDYSVFLAFLHFIDIMLYRLSDSIITNMNMSH